MNVKDNTLIDVIAEIRNNKTGRIREHRGKVSLSKDGKPNGYMWEDKDLNRECSQEIFYIGYLPEQIEGCKKGKYSIRVRGADNGEIFYDEFEENLELKIKQENEMTKKIKLTKVNPSTPHEEKVRLLNGLIEAIGNALENNPITKAQRIEAEKELAIWKAVLEDYDTGCHCDKSTACEDKE